MENSIPQDIKQAFDDSAQYFPTALQQFQFFDKYSRYNYNLGRRETWVETVDRAVNFLREISENKLPEKDYDKIKKAILNLQVMPSMRLLAMAGEAARRSNICIYNCSTIPMDSIDSFVEELIISMNGCGVGYSVEKKYVDELPSIEIQTGEMLPTFIVPDTTDGWAESLRIGLETWFSGKDLEFDYSRLRPAGAPLRIKGGRASGPDPLKKLLDFARDRILVKQGDQLSTLDVHDLCCEIGNAAVSGGVRRTALISLFDQDDLEMRNCKNGDFEKENSQRWNANNSSVWNRRLTQVEIMEQMLDLFKGERGEPGVFSRIATNKTKPLRRKEALFQTNPCVTEDTWIQTNRGPRLVRDLLSSPYIAIVDGKEYNSTVQGFVPTGHKKIYRLVTKEGYSLKATADHLIKAVPYISRKIIKEEWVKLLTLKSGDHIRLNNHRNRKWDGEETFDEGWLLGSLVGDGTFTKKQARLCYWGLSKEQISQEAQNRLQKLNLTFGKIYTQTKHDRAMINSSGLFELAQDFGIYPGHKTLTPEVEKASFDFYQGFLQGLFDADGYVIGTQNKGVSIRLSQSNLLLLQGAQRMLLRMGIISCIYQNRRSEGYRFLPDSNGGTKEFYCNANHELVIANDNIQEFYNLIKFSEPAKQQQLEKLANSYQRTPNRERFVATVKEIIPLDDGDVFDCQIPDINAFDANGIYVHNCGEIALRPYEFCNLSQAVVREEDALETLLEKVELATIIGTIQSMATNFPGLRPIWKQNCEEERLLGVDLNGEADNKLTKDIKVLQQLKEKALETNQKYSKLLNINPSVAITCVKPDGNSSVLLNCASGLHPRYAKYYIRNVRVGTFTPMFKVLKACGVPMDPENGQTIENAITWVAHFPVKSPDGAVIQADLTALDQCKTWLNNKLNYTEHNPSITCSYTPEEMIDLVKWVYEHQDIIGGMSFLPKSEAKYAQMPYQEILKEEYEQLAKIFPKIDFSLLTEYEHQDFTEAAQLLACVSGACEIEYDVVVSP